MYEDTANDEALNAWFRVKDRIVAGTKGWASNEIEATFDDLHVIGRKLSSPDVEFNQYQEACAQLYQVIGYLLERCGMFDSDSGQKALDMASDAASGDPFMRHRNILPWPSDADIPDDGGNSA